MKASKPLKPEESKLSQELERQAEIWHDETCALLALNRALYDAYSIEELAVDCAELHDLHTKVQLKLSDRMHSYFDVTGWEMSRWKKQK